MPGKETGKETGRVCGTCTVCCTTYPVESLGKNAFEPCRYEGEVGCSIYGRHPEECRTYTCGWLEGHFADRDRPDKSGILFERSTLNSNDGSEIEVLLGLITGPMLSVCNTDAPTFAAYAKLGTVVAIAGEDEVGHRVYGHPRDLQIWLSFIAEARSRGILKDSTRGENVRIRVKAEGEGER
jgi:hypothetical protein